MSRVNVSRSGPLTVAPTAGPLLHELIDRRAEATPDATALVFQDSRLTYGELDRRANQLAHHLRSLGVGPDVLVAIAAERSFEMVVGLILIVIAWCWYFVFFRVLM
jgi:non-ribosomal peptide synthetase component F